MPARTAVRVRRRAGPASAPLRTSVASSPPTELVIVAPTEVADNASAAGATSVATSPSPVSALPSADGVSAHSDGGPAAIPSLPADGVYYDSSLAVTYWQSSMDEALTY